MKKVEDKSRVAQEDLLFYEQVDGMKVMEELLLFKGEQIAENTNSVSAKDLDEMALITYGLKSNETNKLYVGMYLDKFYQRASLALGNGRVKVPLSVYEKCKALNNDFRKRQK